MEAGAVATVAAEAGLPFLAVRAVADRADDALPALVEHAVKPDGMPAVGRTLAAMLKNPTQIPATLRLARRSNLALASLRRLDPLKDEDRKSVGEGKSVAVSVALGGRRNINKKKTTKK